MQADRLTVLAAIASDGSALQFASTDLRLETAPNLLEF